MRILTVRRWAEAITSPKVMMRIVAGSVIDLWEYQPPYEGREGVTL